MTKYLLTITFISLFLFGCSNHPRQVEASTSLVEKQSIILGEKVPSKYRDELELTGDVHLLHEKYNIIVGPIYTSSLGLDCRKLNVSGVGFQAQVRVVCANKKQYKEQVRVWRLMPDVVHSETSLQL